jgi:hypothetical protein
MRMSLAFGVFSGRCFQGDRTPEKTLISGESSGVFS